MKRRRSLEIDRAEAETSSRFGEPTEEERKEQEFILRAFHKDTEGLAEGTVVGYMGKFARWWEFREWSRAKRAGALDLFLDLSPDAERRSVWLDYIAYLVEILRIKGQSCYETLSATKKVLSRNGLVDLGFADDSAPEVQEAKRKAKYTIEELQDRAETAAENQKLPMFEELEDALYHRMWADTEDIPFYDQVLVRVTWVGIALMTMTGMRPCNIATASKSKHTILSQNVTLLLLRDGDDPTAAIPIKGGDSWPPGYSVLDGIGVEADFLSQKTGQKLGRKVFPAVDTRSIRLVNGIAYLFKMSGVKGGDPLLTAYRVSPKVRDAVTVSKTVRDSDLSTWISSTAHCLGFQRSHFSSKSCRIGLVTGASWGCGVNWDCPTARETARMGGWADAKKSGAMRRHYDLSTSVYRMLHPDLALKRSDVWEMLAYSERCKQPEPSPFPEYCGQRIGRSSHGVSRPPKKKQRHG